MEDSSKQKEMLASLLETLSTSAKQIQGSTSEIESVFVQQLEIFQGLLDLSHDKLKHAEVRYDELKAKAENAIRISQNNFRIIENEKNAALASLEDAREQIQALRGEVNERISEASSLTDKIAILEKNLKNTIEATQRVEQENSEQLDLLQKSVEADAAQKIKVIEANTARRIAVIEKETAQKISEIEVKYQSLQQEKTALKLELERVRHEAGVVAQNQNQALEDEKALTARQAKLIERYEIELTKLKESKQDLQTRLAIAEENRDLVPSIEAPTQEIEALQLLQRELEKQRQVSQKIKKEMSVATNATLSSQPITSGLER